MEGQAVDLLISDIQKRGLGVSLLVHDDDSGTTNQIKGDFGEGKQDPSIIIQQDIGHCLKNMRKKINEKAKVVKQLSGLGEKIQNFIRNKIAEVRWERKNEYKKHHPPHKDLFRRNRSFSA